MRMTRRERETGDSKSSQFVDCCYDRYNSSILCDRYDGPFLDNCLIPR